jgi:hypothetical protein
VALPARGVALCDTDEEDAVPEQDFEWVEEQFFELGDQMSEWAEQVLRASPAGAPSPSPSPSLVQRLFGSRTQGEEDAAGAGDPLEPDS